MKMISTPQFLCQHFSRRAALSFKGTLMFKVTITTPKLSKNVLKQKTILSQQNYKRLGPHCERVCFPHNYYAKTKVEIRCAETGQLISALICFHYIDSAIPLHVLPKSEISSLKLKPASVAACAAWVVSDLIRNFSHEEAQISTYELCHEKTGFCI